MKHAILAGILLGLVVSPVIVLLARHNSGEWVCNQHDPDGQCSSRVTKAYVPTDCAEEK